MKRKYLKQNNKPNKKELNKFSLLKNIIKNIEKDYIFLAFNIWADHVYKDEDENNLANYQSSFQFKSGNSLNYINGQNEVFSKENNFNSNYDEQENFFKSQSKKYLIEWGNNSIKRKVQNENNLKGIEESLRTNRSEKVFNKKEIKNNKINRNNVQNPYNIKFSNIRNRGNNYINGIKSKKTNKKRKNDFSLITLTDEE